MVAVVENGRFANDKRDRRSIKAVASLSAELGKSATYSPAIFTSNRQ